MLIYVYDYRLLLLPEGGQAYHYEAFVVAGDVIQL